MLQWQPILWANSTGNTQHDIRKGGAAGIRYTTAIAMHGADKQIASLDGRRRTRQLNN